MAKRRFLDKHPLTQAEGLTALIMMGVGLTRRHQRDHLHGAERPAQDLGKSWALRTTEFLNITDDALVPSRSGHPANGCQKPQRIHHAFVHRLPKQHLGLFGTNRKHLVLSCLGGIRSDHHSTAQQSIGCFKAADIGPFLAEPLGTVLAFPHPPSHQRKQVIEAMFAAAAVV